MIALLRIRNAGFRCFSAYFNYILKIFVGEAV